MTISIILPARNNSMMTHDCLTSVSSSLQTLNLKAELILIDDNSDPRERLIDLFQSFRSKATGHEVTVIRTKKRLHYTGVFSVGLHMAKSENMFFLSNDMLITPHFFSAVLGVADLSREFGIVRGTSPYTDSHPEHMVQCPTPLRGYNDICAFSRVRFEVNGLSFTEDRVLSGDAILIKRAVLERIGVMDVQFFGYFGDIDFGLRCHLAGFKLICAKGAWLYHKGGGHVNTEIMQKKKDPSLVNKQRMRLVEEAYQLFRKKWDATLPATYAEVMKTMPTLDFFSVAEKNSSNKSRLRYELPAAVHHFYEVV